jgi:hypothetical protein
VQYHTLADDPIREAMHRDMTGSRHVAAALQDELYCMDHARSVNMLTRRHVFKDLAR